MTDTWGSGELWKSAKGNHVGTVIRRGVRTTTSTGTSGTTSMGVMRIDSIPTKADHIYVFKLMCHPDSTVSTDTVRVDICYQTSGVNATTSDAVLPGSQGFVKLGSPLYIETTFSSAVDFPAMSALLRVTRTAGSGSATLFADGTRTTALVIAALGIDPGDTGVDI